MVALMQDDHEQATGWLSRRPGDAQALFWLGVLSRLGGDASAEAHLAAALALAANLPQADSLRLRARLAVLAGDLAESSGLYEEAARVCALGSLRMEIGYLDLLAARFPQGPAATASSDLRDRTEARIASHALQNTRP